MQVPTACPHCSARFQVAQAVIGKRTRCTKCGEPFVLSESPAAPASTGASSETRPVAKAHSVDFDFDEPVPDRNHTAHAPPIPPAPPDFGNENLGIDANAFEVEDRGQRKSTSVSREYRALRTIARILEILAIIFVALLVIAIVFAIYAYAKQTSPTTQDLTALVIVILQMSFTVGVVDLCLLFISNFIRLNIQIERNTFNSQERAQGLSAQLAALIQIQQNSAKEKEVSRTMSSESERKD